MWHVFPDVCVTLCVCARVFAQRGCLRGYQGEGSQESCDEHPLVGYFEGKGKPLRGRISLPTLPTFTTSSCTSQSSTATARPPEPCTLSPTPKPLLSKRSHFLQAYSFNFAYDGNTCSFELDAEHSPSLKDKENIARNDIATNDSDQEVLTRFENQVPS